MDKISQTIIPVLRKHGVMKASLFGSCIRGDYNEKSDVDILIEPPEGMGLGFVRLKRELEESLGKNVDLISYNGISPYMRKSILQYERRVL